MSDEKYTLNPSLYIGGMDLNPSFMGHNLFRPAGTGGELKLFEQVGIDLVHGWLVDPDSAEYSILQETQDYDTSVNLLVEADHITHGQLVRSNVDPAAEGSSGNDRAQTTDALSSDDQKKVRDGQSPTLSRMLLAAHDDPGSSGHPQFH